MLVTPRAFRSGAGGRALLSRLHRKCLEDLLGDRLLVHELDAEHVRATPLQRLRGYIDGLDPAEIERIVSRLLNDGVDQLYLDGSNLGRVAAVVRSRLPQVRILTFFHNVEARFFYGALKERPRVHAAAVMIANYLAERAAVGSSHKLIALSRRDAAGLASLYGRGATDILPMAMEDRLKVPAQQPETGAGSGYALFVGGAFYANQAGIAWFAENVAPLLSIRTVVIGQGMERLREPLERRGGIEVVGLVDDVAPWYAGAKVVIAPIFDGSGMKTKVAEALMFGKRIVGSREAFSGYEELPDGAGWVCDTKEDFVSALREVERLDLPPFDPTLRAIYERNHSYQAALAGLDRLIA